MATPPLYKYYFLNANGQYYTVSAGSVTTTATKTALPESPRGWDAMKIQFTRDEAGAGVFAKSIEPLEWWGDAAQILRFLWESPFGYHFDAYCRIIIERRNNLWTYDTYLDATLDFSTVDDSTKAVQLINTVGQNEEPFFKVGIIKNSLLQTLQNNNGTEFEIEFDSDAKTINHDGIKLSTSNQFVTSYELTNRGTAAYFIPFVEGKFDGFFRVLEVFPVTFGDLTGNPFKDNKLFVPVLDINNGNVNFVGTATYTNSSASASFQLLYEIFIFRNGDFTTPVNTGNTELYIDPTPLTTGNTRTLNFNENYPFNFLEGDYVCVTSQVTNISGAGTNYDVETEADLVITGDYRFASTDITSLRYPDYAKKLFIAASEGTVSFSSSYLNYSNATLDAWNYRLYNNYPYNTMVTCGDAIRLLPTPKIKSSIADCKLDMFSRWMLGWGINGSTIIVEHLSHFFNKTSEIASLGQIKNFKKSVATDMIYSSMHVGYEDQEYSEVNGRDEVNSEAEYKLPVRNITRTQELVSPYRADIYGIEKQRGYLFDKDTTDNKGDNDTFLMEVDGTPVGGKYPLKRLTGQTYGVSFPETVYNEGLRPSRFVRRHSPFIRSFLNVKDTVAPPASTLAYFQSGKKNTQAFTITSGSPVYEGQDWYVAEALSLQYSRLFLPVYYEFEHTPIENLLSLIENNPYGYIEFEDNNVTYRGFILDVTIESANDDVYQFKLLGCPI